MTDGQERSVRSTRQESEGAVTSLASQALSVLASRRVVSNTRTFDALVRKLEAAVLDRDGDRRAEVLDEMRALAIPDTQIVDEFIPETARLLGAKWCEDEMSFADVTIGTARLQAMLRDLSPPEPAHTSTDVARVAVVVPGEEYHTLGALVLVAQLRRLGFSVRLCLGLDSGSGLAALASERFDAVLLSAAHGEKLVNLSDFVQKLRHALTFPTPIIVGGSAVVRGLTDEGQIGADYITSDLFEALDACGLKISQDDAKRHPTPEKMAFPTA